MGDVVDAVGHNAVVSTSLDAARRRCDGQAGQVEHVCAMERGVGLFGDAAGHRRQGHPVEHDQLAAGGGAGSEGETQRLGLSPRDAALVEADNDAEVVVGVLDRRARLAGTLRPAAGGDLDPPTQGTFR